MFRQTDTEIQTHSVCKQKDAAASSTSPRTTFLNYFAYYCRETALYKNLPVFSYNINRFEWRNMVSKAQGYDIKNEKQ